MIDLSNLIKIKLGIPVVEEFSPILPPCATWSLIGEHTGLAGDGEETEAVEDYEIDLWAKDRSEVVRLSRILCPVLTTIGATIPERQYSYDANGKLWRAMITFSAERKE